MAPCLRRSFIGLLVCASACDGRAPFEADSGPRSVCGNLEVEAGETCDDGNVTDGDGCESYCGTCGDGIVQRDAEQCDSGEVIAGAEPIGRCDDRCRSSGALAGVVNIESGTELVELADGTFVVVGVTHAVAWNLVVARVGQDASVTSNESVEIPEVDTDLVLRDAIEFEAGRLLLAGWERNATPTPWLAEVVLSPLSIRVLALPPLTSGEYTAYLYHLNRDPNGEVVALGRVAPDTGLHEVQIVIHDTEPLDVVVVVGTPRTWTSSSPGRPAMLSDGTFMIPYDEYSGLNNTLLELSSSGDTIRHTIRREATVAVALPGDRLLLGGTGGGANDGWWIQEYDPTTMAFVGPRHADPGSPIRSTIDFMARDPWGGAVFVGWVQTSSLSVYQSYFNGYSFFGRLDSTGEVAWLEGSHNSYPQDFLYSERAGVALGLLSQNAMQRPLQIELRRP